MNEIVTKEIRERAIHLGRSKGLRGEKLLKELDLYGKIKPNSFYRSFRRNGKPYSYYLGDERNYRREANV